MSRPTGRRVGAIDRIRGAALAGMVVFHTAWDLRYFGWIGLDPNRSPAWQAFGHGVATTFLGLSGFSLVLARQRGGDVRSALLRIAVVALAAGAVTLATWAVMPGETVIFGILHCIALGNLLALPLRTAAPAVLLAFAAIAALAPAMLPPVLPASLWWVGLSGVVPETLDYRPLLPWFGAILLGLAAGRIWVSRALPAAGGDEAHSVFALPSPRRRAARGAGAGRTSATWAWAGRHSLSIYLIHQPLIFGALFGLHALWPVPSTSAVHLDAETAPAFLKQCRADCVGKGARTDLCVATCHCVLTALINQARETSRQDGTTPDLDHLTRPCLTDQAGSQRLGPADP